MEAIFLDGFRDIRKSAIVLYTINYFICSTRETVFLCVIWLPSNGVLTPDRTCGSVLMPLLLLLPAFRWPLRTPPPYTHHHHHHRLPFPALALLSGVVLPAIICSTNADTLISNRAAKSAPRRSRPGQNKWRRADTSLLLPLDRPTCLSLTSFHTLSFFHLYSSLSGWPGCSYIIKR